MNWALPTSCVATKSTTVQVTEVSFRLAAVVSKQDLFIMPFLFKNRSIPFFHNDFLKKKKKKNTPFGCCFHMFLTMSLCLVLPGFGKASHIIVGARVYLSTYKNDFMGTIQRKYKL